MSAPTNSDEAPRPVVGGQALLEGVLMRTPERAVAVVRRRDGRLVEREIPVPRRARTRAGRIVGAPFMLLDALRVGSAALQFSAKIYEEEERGSAPNVGGMLTLLWLTGGLTDDVESAPAEGGGAPMLEMEQLKLRHIVPMAISASFALFTLFTAPQAVAWLVAWLLGLLGLSVPVSGFVFQLITVVTLLVGVAAYVGLLGRILEIRRLFMFHGAEHKSVHAFEQGLPLRVENAGRQTRLHPRCGTSLIITLALLSLPWFWGLASGLVWFGLSPLWANLALLGLKLASAPALLALSIEVQRLIARDVGRLRVLRTPGFAFQRLTTREPAADQLEVALHALRRALAQ
ncbi:MAG: DUF1385 domain-containing protein [Polyangiaceae bacterium]|nr:DUF1385 domain-containing protein [Polyangiaceae bacterium]MCB9608019.1 DUF1385 domain-containing protein [Polyangiaceae bacterium]